MQTEAAGVAQLDKADARLEKLVAELNDKPQVGLVQKFKISDAIRHVAAADGRRLEQLVIKCGVPDHYLEEAREVDTFRSMSRIIVGQQLAGSAVRAIWAKFTAFFGDDVSAITPEAVLAEDMELLRSSAGLSNAKVKAIFELAAHYQRGALSDAVLLDPFLSDAERSAKLTAVKGVGPWSANMFQLFSLAQPDIFPTGDLGVRNGVAKAFCLRGSGRNGSLDEKKDAEKLAAAMAPYAPFRSYASWLMWRALETPSFME